MFVVSEWCDYNHLKWPGAVTVKIFLFQRLPSKVIVERKYKSRQMIEPISNWMETAIGVYECSEAVCVPVSDVYVDSHKEFKCPSCLANYKC